MKAVNIFYVGDTHGCLEGENGLGGFAFLTTLFNQPDLQDKDTLTLRLFGGDICGSYPLSNEFEQEPDVEIMRLWNLDACVVGNHDLDHGPRRLLKFIRTLHAPNKKPAFLAANMDVSQEPLLAGLTQPFYLNESHGVVVIGLTTLEAAKGSHGGPHINFMEPHDVLRYLIPLIKSQNINKIIILSHLGYEEDQKLARCELINFSDLDFVILGNHTHTILGDNLDPQFFEKSSGSNPTVVENGKQKVLITAAGYHGFMIGHLQVEYDDSGRIVGFNSNPQVVVDQSKIKSDEQSLKIIDKYRRELTTKKPDFCKVMAHTEVNIIGLDSFLFCKSLEDINRREESICGNLAADGYFHFVREKLCEKTDFALFHAGGFRADIPKGPIYYWQLEQAHPYPQQKLVTLILTGEQIFKIFEESLSGLNKEEDYHRNAAFLHVSAGVTYTYHFEENNKANRIKTIELNGKPISFHEDYRVTVNSFMLGLDKGDKALYPTLQAAALIHLGSESGKKFIIQHDVRDLDALCFECRVHYKDRAIDTRLLQGRIKSNLPLLRDVHKCDRDLNPIHKTELKLEQFCTKVCVM